jgi:hypothetical protein
LGNKADVADGVAAEGAEGRADERFPIDDGVEVEEVHKNLIHKVVTSLI